MNQKGVAVAAVAVVVIIIAVAGVGAFILLSGGGVSVTSFDVKADITYHGSTTDRYRVKDLGSQNLKVRGDTLSGGYAGTSFIIRSGESKMYVYEDNQWVDYSGSVKGQYDIQRYSSAMQNIANHLSKWTAGDVNFEYQGVTYRLYEIQVNPTLSDDIFQPS
jgi:hypothetical protein